MGFSITHSPIEPPSAPPSEQSGAVVTFEGRVRVKNAGRRVLRLDYTAYETLAVKEGELIVREAMALHGLAAVSIIHRVGTLHIGDMAVLIRVESSQRAAAFDGCRWVLDQLKERVPIWKREHYDDGAEWL